MFMSEYFINSALYALLESNTVSFTIYNLGSDNMTVNYVENLLGKQNFIDHGYTDPSAPCKIQFTLIEPIPQLTIGPSFNDSHGDLQNATYLLGNSTWQFYCKKTNSPTVDYDYLARFYIDFNATVQLEVVTGPVLKLHFQTFKPEVTAYDDSSIGELNPVSINALFGVIGNLIPSLINILIGDGIDIGGFLHRIIPILDLSETEFRMESHYTLLEMTPKINLTSILEASTFPVIDELL
jgi:hypothetical protein